MDKPPGAEQEEAAAQPIQCSPLTGCPRTGLRLYGLMHSAVPDGGVCDHSVLIMEGGDVFFGFVYGFSFFHFSRMIGIGSTSSETVSYRKTKHGFNKKLMIGGKGPQRVGEQMSHVLVLITRFIFPLRF